MSKTVRTEIQTKAHPRSAQQWFLLPDAINALAAKLVGMPVTMNYRGDEVGKVKTVEVTDGRIFAEIEVVDPMIGKFLESDGYAVGPALENPENKVDMRGAGEYPMGADWTAKMLGAVKTDPEPEPKIVGAPLAGT